jgi:hypothetical protein
MRDNRELIWKSIPVNSNTPYRCNDKAAAQVEMQRRLYPAPMVIGVGVKIQRPFIAVNGKVIWRFPEPPPPDMMPPTKE